MSKQKKNVIFLIVDSLRYDRLGYAGHEPSPTPFLDTIARKGITFDQCYATGCPTDFAYPGLVSSVLPLDNGGYLNGLSNRKITLSEVFKEAQYHTVLFLQDAWPSTYHQTRGYDDVFYVHSFNRFRVDFMDYIPLIRNYITKDPENEDGYIEYFSSRLDALFKDINHYMDCGNGELSKKYFSLLNSQYDISKIKELNSVEEREYTGNPVLYCRNVLTQSTLPEGLNALMNSLIPRKRTQNVVQKRYLLLSFEIYLFNIFKIFQNCVDKKQVARFGLRHSQCLASAKVFINSICEWMDVPDQKPFFMWVHLTDPHEMNFYSYESDEINEDIEFEFQSVKEHFYKILRKIWVYRGNPEYDLSVRYVDHQIERLYNYLVKKDLWENTILIICADHGCLYSAWPKRPDNAHCTTHFFEELYHIPVIIAGGGMPSKTIHQLNSTMDIAPSLLDLLHIKTPESYKGHSYLGINEPYNRQFIISEHMGPGLCNWRIKPIFVCVRSQDWKLVYKSPTIAQKEQGYIHALFNLKEDPLEQKDLANILPYSEQIIPLLNIAKERLNELAMEQRINIS